MKLLGQGLLYALGFTLRLVVSLFILAIPLAGAWGLSSLAALHGGERWLASAAGLLAFPVLPLAWELWARWKTGSGPSILRPWDRLVLRTLALNTVFIAGVLCAGPQMLFTALSARGDWMLDGRTGQTAEIARRVVLRTADGFEWLYDAWDEPNEYDELVDDTHRADLAPSDEDPARANGRESTESGEPEVADVWPPPAAPRESARVPPDAQRDPASAAHYIAAHEPSELDRARAIHDFVAQRVAYDGVALSTGNFPPQDAATVFATRKGVCAGYANLFAEMAQAAGLEVVVVVGNTRELDGDIAPGPGHAWNAVKAEGTWYLVDTTWDAGHLEGTTFHPQYKTDYLFTPPAIFAASHLPELPEWQLQEQPISRGEFTRQPNLRPSFTAQGFELLNVDRSQTTVDDQARVVVRNTEGAYLSASWSGEGREGRCALEGRDTIEVLCDLPVDGVYTVVLFSNPTQSGMYWDVGSLGFVRR